MQRPPSLGVVCLAALSTALACAASSPAPSAGERADGQVSSTVDAGTSTSPAIPEPWCCLEQALEWRYTSFGWVHPVWRLTREGTLERIPWQAGRSQPGDAGAAEAPAGTLSTRLPECGSGPTCLRDVRDALAHPEVAVLLPEGRRFADALAFDGTAVALEIEGAEIVFGLPFFDDLPAGARALYAVLERLEVEHLYATVPSCRGASLVSYESTTDPRGQPWAMSAYLGRTLLYETCADALACECDSRERIDPTFTGCDVADLAIDASCARQ